MYHKEFYPFYTAYAEAGLFDGQKVQDQEFELMKSYYPSAARRVQAQVEQECDLMDYEGSRIYDQPWKAGSDGGSRYVCADDGGKYDGEHRLGRDQ